jgi:hypothetical protein
MASEGCSHFVKFSIVVSVTLESFLFDCCCLHHIADALAPQVSQLLTSLLGVFINRPGPEDAQISGVLISHDENDCG